MANITNGDDKNYNCYAYSIGRYNDYLDPGEVNKDEGESYSKGMEMFRLIRLVKQDLEDMDYTDIQDVPASAFSTVLCTKLLIAVRLSENGDYHFMRYDYSEGKWYHKPGESAILRYIGDPLASTAVWTNEMWKDGQYVPGLLNYTSAIYCIGAGVEHHHLSYIYQGNNRHRLTCDDCNTATGSLMACVMVGNTCSVCGHTDSTGGGDFDIMSVENP